MEVLRSLEGETGGDVHPLAGEKIGGKRKVRNKTKKKIEEETGGILHPLAGEKNWREKKNEEKSKIKDGRGRDWATLLWK